MQRNRHVSAKTIEVVGAGIAGLWQALTLAQRGHQVTLVERSPAGFERTASGMAGGMIAPFCEVETAEPLVQDLGLQGLRIWQDALSEVVTNGTLVVAPARDRAELTRFARMTEGHQDVSGEVLAVLEPELAGRFSSALFYEKEAHVDPLKAQQALLGTFESLPNAARRQCETLPDAASSPADFLIDCRGYAAAHMLPDLRGVRGEMILLRCPNVGLARPIRFLHPRMPIYLVPRGDGNYMLGATMVESDDTRTITVRGALELLSGAYGLHPGLAEAEIIASRAGIRPAFPDNLPKIIVRGPHIHVNGLYRHGYLLAPVLARMVADFIAAPESADASFGRIQVEETA